MRFVILGCLIGLGIAIGFGLLVATPEELFELFDPHRPATLFPLTAGRLRAVPAQIRELVQDLVDELAAPYRERLHRDLPAQSSLP